MNIKQSYFDFLNANGAKEKIENVITAKIEEWKMQQAIERTKRLRPDLL